ncbi:GntR family transcriptional regulator [Rubellimicrobium sp. CFH 75288]|uniref:GntR family transcriptional regulator n=1 Tax=Rubellimicrobium sp. CFH 75288 TaxID=2697034 RepID=UPI001412376C|nr:GntR family transcriptional regulator [Rubellimicrobium sp. CFH 75288]NAZ35438.1 UTRA domain-containing protein [Rubellimicrobium sp. CFH 75288]
MREALRSLGWRDVAEIARARILARDWAAGGAIPTEAALAREFGVSRATVNRALRALAEEGLIDRRRRAGSRVTARPTRRATFALPLVRDEVSASGAVYGYRLLDRELCPPPAEVALRLGLRAVPLVLRLEALHLADGRPWAHEDRWINPAAAPGVEDVDFAAVSANEWLVTHVPFTTAEVTLSAEAAEGRTADALGCEPGAAILVLDRVTRLGATGVTAVRLGHAPGYRLVSRP